MTLDIVFNLQPVQDKLYQIYEFGDARIIGFGGSRGGTKSYTADVLMIIRRRKYPATNGLIVMKVYQDIWDIHLTPLFNKYPVLRSMFNVQQMMLTFPNKSYIRFLSGDSLKEFEERKGREFADIIIDQSELFEQKEIESLSTINRSTNLQITPKMLLLFNPGGVSHSYNKRLFFELNYEGNEVAENYAFLQTFGWDNAYWSQRRLNEEGLTIDDYHKWDSDTRFKYFLKTDYGRILDQLPESKRKAELLGDMDIFEGMFFNEFRRNIHVINNYEISRHFTTVGGLDYGNTTVLEVLQRDYEGTIVSADECYLPDCESPSERANLISDFLLERKLFKLLIIYDTDMDISQISNVGFDKTPIQIFNAVFQQRMGDDAPAMVVVNKTSLDHNKNYRESVNDAIHEFLKVTNGKPKVYFSDKCKYLIKEISTLIHPPNDADGRDYLNTGANKPHAIDAFKMPFYAIWEPVKKETPKPVSARQAAVNLIRETKTITSF